MDDCQFQILCIHYPVDEEGNQIVEDAGEDYNCGGGDGHNECSHYRQHVEVKFDLKQVNKVKRICTEVRINGELFDQLEVLAPTVDSESDLQKQMSEWWEVFIVNLLTRKKTNGEDGDSYENPYEIVSLADSQVVADILEELFVSDSIDWLPSKQVIIRNHLVEFPGFKQTVDLPHTGSDMAYFNFKETCKQINFTSTD